jgi:hypothetical protein
MSLWHWNNSLKIDMSLWHWNNSLKIDMSLTLKRQSEDRHVTLTLKQQSEDRHVAPLWHWNNSLKIDMSLWHWNNSLKIDMSLWHWNNSLKIDMSLYSDTLSCFCFHSLMQLKRRSRKYQFHSFLCDLTRDQTITYHISGVCLVWFVRVYYQWEVINQCILPNSHNKRTPVLGWAC